MKEFDIKGIICVENDINEQDFTDMFIDIIESKKITFCGSINNHKKTKIKKEKKHMNYYVKNTIEDFKKIKKEYTNSIETFLKKEISKIDSNIIISVEDMKHINVTYDCLEFVFMYAYSDNGLIIRGADISSFDDNSFAEEREKAFEHIKNTLKMVL